MKVKFYDDGIEITVELERYCGKEYLCDYGSMHIYEDVYEPYEYTFLEDTYQDLFWKLDIEVPDGLSKEEIRKLLVQHENEIKEYAEEMASEPDYYD